MSDIDTRLEHGQPEPRRPLRTDFTNKVLQTLDKANRPKRPKWKEYIQMNILHKPAMATAMVALTVIVGGSVTYATVGGIRALFGGQQSTDGGRIVKVNTQNCPHIDVFNITQKDRSTNATYYYKINNDSKLTNDQVVAMVQGACEADAEGIANGAAERSFQELPENKDKLVGGYADSVITAISSTSLSIHSVMPVYSKNGPTNEAFDQTFTHIDPNVLVVSNGQKQAYNSLQVGNHISVTYRATGDALSQSETLPVDQINTSQQTLAIITKVSKHTSEYFDYQKYHIREFAQVIPCNTQASGYCTIEQYNRK